MYVGQTINFRGKPYKLAIRFKNFFVGISLVDNEHIDIPALERIK